MVAALIVAAAAGCSLGQSGQSGHSPSPRFPSVAATLPPSATQLSTWQKCGATQVPPADVLKMPAQLPKVINRTNGAVSDADAQKWVAAAVREQQIENWALANEQEAVFMQGCIGSQASVLNLFGSELTYMRTAKASGRRLEVQSGAIPSIAVVKVPSDVNDKVKGLDGTPSEFALVIEVQGPGGINYVDGSGNRSPAATIKPSDHFYKFLGGQYTETGIGAVWVQGSVFSCATPWLKQTCGF